MSTKIEQAMFDLESSSKFDDLKFKIGVINQCYELIGKYIEKIKCPMGPSITDVFENDTILFTNKFYSTNIKNPCNYFGCNIIITDNLIRWDLNKFKLIRTLNEFNTTFTSTEVFKNYKTLLIDSKFYNKLNAYLQTNNIKIKRLLIDGVHVLKRNSVEMNVLFTWIITKDSSSIIQDYLGFNLNYITSFLNDKSILIDVFNKCIIDCKLYLVENITTYEYLNDKYYNTKQGLINTYERNEKFRYLGLFNILSNDIVNELKSKLSDIRKLSMIEKVNERICIICMSYANNYIITLCCQNIYCRICYITSLEESLLTCAVCRAPIIDTINKYIPFKLNLKKYKIYNKIIENILTNNESKILILYSNLEESEFYSNLIDTSYIDILIDFNESCKLTNYKIILFNLNKYTDIVIDNITDIIIETNLVDYLFHYPKSKIHVLTTL